MQTPFEHDHVRPDRFEHDRFEHDQDDPTPRARRTPRRRRRFDDDSDHDTDHDDPDHDDPGRRPRPRPAEVADLQPPAGDRWSTWERAEHGPLPRPGWVITEAAAVDTELGSLKSGKEADVHLLEREIPGTGRRCLLAAKRYRPAHRRMFHRDAGYLEGRRVRRSRETRAMANRTAFGRALIADQWAAAEFTALGTLWSAGAPVPYPVQRDGGELLLEFVGEPDGAAAPRLAQLRPAPDELADLWHQLTGALTTLAHQGVAHGDLSAFNLLVHRGRLVMIDLPQVVDVVANPGGPGFLDRDVRTVCAWFTARGLPAGRADPDALLARLVSVLW